LSKISYLEFGIYRGRWPMLRRVNFSALFGPCGPIVDTVDIVDIDCIIDNHDCIATLYYIN